MMPINGALFDYEWSSHYKTRVTEGRAANTARLIFQMIISRAQRGDTSLCKAIERGARLIIYYQIKEAVNEGNQTIRRKLDNFHQVEAQRNELIDKLRAIENTLKAIR